MLKKRTFHRDQCIFENKIEQTMVRDNFTDLSQLRLKLDLEGFNSELLYWGYFDGTEWWRNYMHRHSFFEICYVLNGSGDFTINGVTSNVKTGDLFIAKPNEKHEIIADQKNPMSIFYWAYTLIKTDGNQKSDIAQLLSAFQRTNTTICSNQQNIARILDALTYETNQKAAAYRFIVEGLVKQLIIETARVSTRIALPRLEEEPLSYHQTIVKTIKRYLNDNYSQPLKLKQVAAQVHLSERHMSRVFKEITGSGIKQYFTGVKINVAKQLMLNTSKSINEVAYETGFQDARHFSTVFRKNVGASPTDFRSKGGTEFV